MGGGGGGGYTGFESFMAPGLANNALHIAK